MNVILYVEIFEILFPPYRGRTTGTHTHSYTHLHPHTHTHTHTNSLSFDPGISPKRKPTHFNSKSMGSSLVRFSIITAKLDPAVVSL